MKFQAILIGSGCAAWMWGAAATESVAPAKPLEKPVEVLVAELADDQFKVREEASRELWKLGEQALPALQAAADGKEPEQAYRARDLIRKIELFITPDTDPSVIKLVEQYTKASINGKRDLFEKLQRKKAWRQILKLYAAETNPDLQSSFQALVDSAAVTAARECLMRNDARGAQEFLEMAPADAAGLLALADFHRSQGSLDSEIKRALTLEGPKAAAWQLALYRVSGNVEAARAAADAADEPKISAAMSVLAGDPLPWMRAGLTADGGRTYKPYLDLAIKRWQGMPVRASDLESLERSANSRSERDNGINALFMLGEADKAAAALVKASPQEAFSYFDTMEMIPEALAALGFSSQPPDFAGWVEERMKRLGKSDEDEVHEGNQDIVDLLLLANFMERRGMGAVAENVFLKPLAALAEDDDKKFTEFLGMLFSDVKIMEGNAGGAPLLAAKATEAWAGEKEERWEDVLGVAFNEVEEVMPLWDWLAELDPSATRMDRLEALLALTGKTSDPQHLRDRWLNLGWAMIEKSPEAGRDAGLDKMRMFATLAPDLERSIRLWNASKVEGENSLRRINPNELTAAGRWKESADLWLKLIEREGKGKHEPNLELHARAAGCLRKAGRVQEADAQDALIDKLALGRDAFQIARGYRNVGEFARSNEWFQRACFGTDPAEGDFFDALTVASENLLEDGNWKLAASCSEIMSLIYASADIGVDKMAKKVTYRLQADFCRALAHLKDDREASIALLARCHRMCITSGSLADHFFPALRQVGLIKEHDEWFTISWDALSGLLKQYPASDNTYNTAGWLGSRAMRNLDQSEEYLKKALTLNPYESNYIDTMAEIQFARGDRDKALEWSTRALNFTPGSDAMNQQYEHFRNDPLPK